MRRISRIFQFRFRLDKLGVALDNFQQNLIEFLKLIRVDMMPGLRDCEDLDVLHVLYPGLLEAVLCQLWLDPGILTVDDRHPQLLINVRNPRDNRVLGPGKVIAKAKTQSNSVQKNVSQYPAVLHNLMRENWLHVECNYELG